MDFDSYDSLQADIAAYVQRNNLSDQIPLFIKMAETKLRRVMTKFPQQFAEPYTIVPAVGTTLVAYPSDFGMISKVEYGNRTLRYIPPESTSKNRSQFISSEYTLRPDGVYLQMVANGQTPLTIYYYSLMPSLSDLNESNWVLEDYPDIYLYASLVEAFMYIGDDASVQKYSAALSGAVSDASAQVVKARTPQDTKLTRKLS